MSNVESRQVRRARERDGKKPKFSILEPKNFKSTLKFLDKFTPEQQENVAAKLRTYGDDPIDIAKGIAADMLASEVREEFASVIKPEDYAGIRENFAREFNMPEFLKLSNDETLGFIDGEHVEDILECIVNGDGIIEDAGKAKWFRDKLAAFRDFGINLDNNATQIHAETVVLNLLKAIHQFDVIVDTCPEPTAIGIIVNAKGREVFGDCAEYEPVPVLPGDWQGFSLTQEGVKQTDATVQKIATTLAKAYPGARIGYCTGKYREAQAAVAT
jgi:hypothetical protein